MKTKKVKKTKKVAIRDLKAEKAAGVKGGRDGSLDAGLHFKYDIKGNKEG